MDERTCIRKEGDEARILIIRKQIYFKPSANCKQIAVLISIKLPDIFRRCEKSTSTQFMIAFNPVNELLNYRVTLRGSVTRQRGVHLKMKCAYVYDEHTCCGISIGMHTESIWMRHEIPKLLVIRGVIYIYLLGIQYPSSTRNTSDIRSAPRLPHRLKLRPDVSLRSVNKIYSCGIYCLLSSACRYMQNIAYFLPLLLTVLAESRTFQQQ